MSGQFFLRISLQSWKKPSFLGNPLVRSLNVTKPRPQIRPPRNSPSNLMPSDRKKIPLPWNHPCMNSPSYLCYWRMGQKRRNDNERFISKIDFDSSYFEPSGKFIIPNPLQTPFTKDPSTMKRRQATSLYYAPWLQWKILRLKGKSLP